MNLSRRYIAVVAIFVLFLPIMAQYASAKVDVKVAFWDQGEENRVSFQAVIDRFNASQDKINAVADPIPGNLGAVVLARIAGGTGPDVVWWTSNGIPGMVVQDMVVDLSAYIKRDNFDLDDFFPTSLDGYRFDKKLYGLPLTAPMSGFVYNMDMFDVAGIDYPDNEWTWDDVLAVARKLLKRDGAGRAQVFGITGFFGFFESNTSFTPIMWAYGGKLFDPIDFPIRSHVTSKEVIDSIAYVRDLRFKYRVAPMPGEQSRFSGVDYFIAGESAMAFSTPTLANTMKKAQSKIRWNATLMPKGPRGRGAGGNSAGMCILSSSRNPNAAWEFLKFLTSTEGFIIFDKALGSGATFPPRKSALKKVLVNYPDRNIDLNAYIESISFTLPFMYRTLPGCDIWSPIGDAISKIYSGQMDVLPAMKQINPVLETTLKKQAVELERYMR